MAKRDFLSPKVSRPENWKVWVNYYTSYMYKNKNKKNKNSKYVEDDLNLKFFENKKTNRVG